MPFIDTLRRSCEFFQMRGREDYRLRGQNGKSFDCYFLTCFGHTKAPFLQFWVLTSHFCHRTFPSVTLETSCVSPTRLRGTYYWGDSKPHGDAWNLKRHQICLKKTEPVGQIGSRAVFNLELNLKSQRFRKGCFLGGSFFPLVPKVPQTLAKILEDVTPSDFPSLMETMECHDLPKAEAMEIDVPWKPAEAMAIFETKSWAVCLATFWSNWKWIHIPKRINGWNLSSTWRGGLAGPTASSFKTSFNTMKM